MKYISFSCISYQLILLKVNKKHHIDSFNHQLLVYKSSYFPPFSSLFPSERRITALMWNVGLSLLLHSVTPGLCLPHGGQSLAAAFIQFLSRCGDEKPQPFGLGAQLPFPAQQLLVCGRIPQAWQQGAVWICSSISVAPSDIICIYIVNKCVCLEALWESQDPGHCLWEFLRLFVSN